MSEKFSVSFYPIHDWFLTFSHTIRLIYALSSSKRQNCLLEDCCLRIISTNKVNVSIPFRLCTRFFSATCQQEYSTTGETSLNIWSPFIDLLLSSCLQKIVDSFSTSIVKVKWSHFSKCLMSFNEINSVDSWKTAHYNERSSGPPQNIPLQNYGDQRKDRFHPLPSSYFSFPLSNQRAVFLLTYKLDIYVHTNFQIASKCGN